jgi:hypothetical protein
MTCVLRCTAASPAYTITTYLEQLHGSLCSLRLCPLPHPHPPDHHPLPPHTLLPPPPPPAATWTPTARAARRPSARQQHSRHDWGATSSSTSLNWCVSWGRGGGGARLRPGHPHAAVLCRVHKGVSGQQCKACKRSMFLFDIIVGAHEAAPRAVQRFGQTCSSQLGAHLSSRFTRCSPPHLCCCRLHCCPPSPCCGLRCCRLHCCPPLPPFPLLLHSCLRRMC